MQPRRCHPVEPPSQRWISPSGYNLWAFRRFSSSDETLISRFAAITPVFDVDSNEIIFFTASRGHHADIGGISAGSMPPTSKTIFEEGAAIKSFKIVNKGKYQRDELLRYLCDEPAKYPGCSGTRCLSDVESDLKAQISANNKGATLIRSLIQEYSLETVQQYMLFIRDK